MANVYRFERQASPDRYRIDPADTIDRGDLLKWDAGNFKVIPMTAGAEADFVGVAMGQIPPASNIDNVAGSTYETDIQVFHHGVFRFKATATESYEHGDAVHMGADAQTVSLATLPADKELVIGYVWRPKASAALVAVAGDEVDVYISANIPAHVAKINTPVALI